MYTQKKGEEAIAYALYLVESESLMIIIESFERRRDDDNKIMHEEISQTVNTEVPWRVPTY